MVGTYLGLLRNFRVNHGYKTLHPVEWLLRVIVILPP